VLLQKAGGAEELLKRPGSSLEDLVPNFRKYALDDSERTVSLEKNQKRNKTSQVLRLPSSEEQ